MNRLIYDECATAQRLKQSTHCYQFYGGKYINQNVCRIGFGILGGNEVSTANSMVDVESELRGQTRLSSQCPASKQFSSSIELMHKPACQIAVYPAPVVEATPMGQWCKN